MASMEGDRIETAVQRIEQALARIADVADREPAEAPAAAAAASDAKPELSPNVSQLVVHHEHLRETIVNEIKRLDEVIGKLES